MMDLEGTMMVVVVEREKGREEIKGTTEEFVVDELLANRANQSLVFTSSVTSGLVQTFRAAYRPS
jgi:hypothetical protein